MDMMSKHIRLIRLRREEKNREAKNQGLKHLASRYKSLASPENATDKPATAAPTPKVKAPPATPPKNDVAAPVLADPKAKQHAKGKGKGKKGRGKSRDRTRSPSAPRTAAEKKKKKKKKNIPCRFRFGNGTTCNKGKDCEFSHNNASTPRANSPAGAKKSVCYAFLQGKCTKGKDYKYVRDKKALAVIKSSAKAEAALPRGS